jgi:mannose-1-phosphate guanylyltransferase
MLHAVIMAGGSGTRFWPESRNSRPKQLLPITGGNSMLAETVSRVQPLIPLERIWVVTNAVQAEGVRLACPDLPHDHILVEPCARNTAACVGLAATVVHAHDPDATMAVLPADHAISPAEEFQRSLKAGAEVAAEPGALVTFGIQPTYPATGYGYIRQGACGGQKQGLSFFDVDNFYEKPFEDVAQGYLDEGVYLWNAGIFVWRSDSILKAFAKYLPSISDGLQQIAPLAQDSAALQKLVDELYPDFQSVSVDVGILEPSDSVRVLKAPYHWSDVGSWRALFDELDQDGDGNSAVFPNGGDLMAEDATGLLAYSRTPKTVAVLGVNDLVIVHTEDAILVAKRDRAEDVKRFVDRLKVADRTELL